MGKHNEKSKKHKNHKKTKRKHSSESSNSSEDEWVEKPTSSATEWDLEPPLQREDWMSLPTTFTSISQSDKHTQRKIEKQLEREEAAYNPRLSSRELNPYWKGGGDGLPKFQKPSDDYNSESYQYKRDNTASNWRKPKVPETNINVSSDTPTDLNALAAKLLKAEILGNTTLVAELKDKLEKARAAQNDKEQDVILTHTDSKGYSRPIKEYGEYSGTKRKKMETHNAGECVRYFPDDEKYNLKQMFEREKQYSVDDSNREFMKYAGKVSKNDDLDDIFMDKIRQTKDENSMNKNKAVQEHRETMEALENCTNCLQSPKMIKHLMISTRDNIYMSLPAQEPLTVGHCLLIPLRHTPCSTHLDENEWDELITYRKLLTRFFELKNEDVIFFETAMFLHRHPHMTLHCVPLPKEQGDLAPIYFKKAIDDSEREWSSNKKLVSLSGRDVRRAIPKGLPYFAVSFGMKEGFAHVIEDQRLFPVNFAQEIIGGILDLHHSKWRKPKIQKYEEQKQRILDFSREWTSFDS